MKRLKLTAVAAKFSAAKDDDERLIALDTMEKILVLNLARTRKRREQIEMRSKYRKFKQEKQSKPAVSI